MHWKYSENADTCKTCIVYIEFICSVAQGDWIDAKARNEFVGVIAFDLSAAFDTISNTTLLDKLKNASYRFAADLFPILSIRSILKCFVEWWFEQAFTLKQRGTPG